MSHVAIEKIDGKKEGIAIPDELKAITQQIRQRAYELFERRGGGDGMATDDWAKAERELFEQPQSELVEQDGKFDVKVGAAGFNPGDIKVTALPGALIVRAASTHGHEERDCEVRFCEFGQKTLFRRFDLPDTINIDKVTANLEKGILHVTALKEAKDATQLATAA